MAAVIIVTERGENVNFVLALLSYRRCSRLKAKTAKEARLLVQRAARLDETGSQRYTAGNAIEKPFQLELCYQRHLSSNN
jgi:hypothetical protein